VGDRGACGSRQSVQEEDTVQRRVSGNGFQLTDSIPAFP
jgi:hypothetical protein